jgi:hypothetical protein
VKEIPVSGGLVALVDDADYELVRAYTWTAVRSPDKRSIYAKAYIPGSPPRRNVRMHRLILDASRDIGVDHIDLDGLNNQRGNLRFATNGQNKRNSAKYRTAAGNITSSTFKGVSWDQQGRRWRAQCRVNGKRTHLGSFRSEAEAALVYNKVALKQYGEFARLNVLQERIV